MADDEQITIMGRGIELLDTDTMTDRLVWLGRHDKDGERVFLITVKSTTKESGPVKVSLNLSREAFVALISLGNDELSSDGDARVVVE